MTSVWDDDVTVREDDVTVREDDVIVRDLLYTAEELCGFSAKILRRKSPSSPGLKVEGTMT
jgi:hypothetical protein